MRYIKHYYLFAILYSLLFNSGFPPVGYGCTDQARIVGGVRIGIDTVSGFLWLSDHQADEAVRGDIGMHAVSDSAAVREYETADGAFRGI